MQNIQLLPEHIIDQIKAGEVIERPSALVKEIIENSIDAGSTQIELHLIDNGLELISIIDNGKGMNANELPLAFCRHATSKIDRFEDIYKLHSYGFRGEALASIASISKLNCETKTKSQSGLIRIEGGQTLLHDVDQVQNELTGTKIFIKELFYNTPARLKFIQSKTSEKNHLKKIINAFLLTHPEICFHIKWDDSPKEIYNICELEQRIHDVFFQGKNIHLEHATQEYDGVQVEIFLSQESTRGNAHKNQYIFINERYVQDIQIHKIILNSAKTMWPEGETGHYMAFLKIPTDEIDVNVHPSKTVIKLFRGPKVYSVVSGSIKQLLSSNVQQAKPVVTQDDFFQNQNDFQPKDIQYKSVDFTQNNSIDRYFESLHSQSDRESKPLGLKSKLMNIGPFNLIELNEKVYLIHKNKFMQQQFYTLLNQKDIADHSAPLLVSRPIKVIKKPSEKTLRFIESLGYEVDMLAKDTLVMRSFPQKIQSFPYIKLLEMILEKGAHDLNIELLNDIDYSEISTFFFNEQLQSSSIYDLIATNLIKEIKETDLQKIYE